jgi:hypothetical protein
VNLSFLLFVGVAAVIFAKLEIEIEGPHGWAEKLPTWRIEHHFLLDWLFGGRPLTGYHVWTFVFVLLLFHLPFFFNGTWTFPEELNIIGGYLLFWLLEDMMWFILNPHFGWKQFTKDNVWWHKRWFLGLPVEYWIGGGAAVVLLTVP